MGSFLRTLRETGEDVPFVEVGDVPHGLEVSADIGEVSDRVGLSAFYEDSFRSVHAEIPFVRNAVSTCTTCEKRRKTAVFL